MSKVDFYMKKMGFMKYEASQTDQEKQDIELLKEMGIEKKNFYPVVYERKLSTFTSFIVEGEYKRGTYYYDFYKIKYHYKTKDISDIKIYCQNLRLSQILGRVNGMLVYCDMLTEEVNNELIEIKWEVKESINKNYQKELDVLRKKSLDILS